MKIEPISWPHNKHIGFYEWIITIYLFREENLLSYVVMTAYRMFFKKLLFLAQTLCSTSWYW